MKWKDGTLSKMVKSEKVIDLSPINQVKKVPKGYKKATKTMIKNLKPGDYIVADLGGVEYAKGKVDNPKHINIVGDKVIEFWCYSGWRHIEHAKPEEVIAIKKMR